MHVIGTAGHVDHGKSALVKRLTGIDPDRLEEEKRRGLTIDLGFAWLQLTSGREVGIVDVPGHEKFIRNMLAGAGAVNATIFVVAANEGWMPQSQEHLDILDLLGISSAVVAVTKCDTVDEETLAGVTEQVVEHIQGTALEGAPVVPTSAETGRGFDELLSYLDSLVAQAPPAVDWGRPRLWIDRVFTMKGSGTVVTGTLVGGALTADQEIEILPGRLSARIRGIQSHRRSVETIGPGNRTALNLSGVDKQVIERGQVVALPGSWRPTARIAGDLRFLEHLGHPPSEKGAFKLYLGSSETDVRLRFLTEPRLQDVAAVIDLHDPVVADFGDRFVVRDAGRRETLGGGVVLEPHLGEHRRWGSALPALIESRRGLDRTGYLDLLIREEGSLSKKEARLRAGPLPDYEPAGAVTSLNDHFVAEDHLGSWLEELLKALTDFQSKNPHDPGMPRTEARQLLDVDPPLFEEVVAEWERRGAIVADGEFLRTPDHAPAAGGPERDQLLEQLRKSGVSPPTLSELQKQFDPALVRALIRKGDLVQISPELVFTPSVIQSIKKAVVEEIRDQGPVTVAGFRDAVGTTRKYAVPLLEYLDRIGFTIREGDHRRLGSNTE